MKVVYCDYCGNNANLVNGDSIYPHRPDLFKKKFYLCVPCNAYVGCHPNTTKPLGRVANSELRRWKSITHSVFDPLWKSKKMSRAAAYEWLSSVLKINKKDCHIGMFDIEMCKRAVNVIEANNE